MRTLATAFFLGLVWLAGATTALGAASPGASTGCFIHIAGHPGESLELIGLQFSRSSIVQVDYTVDGANPHSTTVTTDATGSFNLVIPTGPTHTGVYDFVITDPRCTLTPSAIAVPATSPSPVNVTPPPTDAVSAAPRRESPLTVWLAVLLVVGSAVGLAAATLVRRTD